MIFKIFYDWKFVLKIRHGKEEEIMILKRRISELTEDRNRIEEERKSSESKCHQLRTQNQQWERKANEFQFQLQKLNDRIQQVFSFYFFKMT